MSAPAQRFIVRRSSSVLRCVGVGTFDKVQVTSTKNFPHRLSL
jgi:hypothetical protein